MRRLKRLNLILGESDDSQIRNGMQQPEAQGLRGSTINGGKMRNHALIITLNGDSATQKSRIVARLRSIIGSELKQTCFVDDANGNKAKESGKLPKADILIRVRNPVVKS